MCAVTPSAIIQTPSSFLPGQMPELSSESLNSSVHSIKYLDDLVIDNDDEQFLFIDEEDASDTTATNYYNSNDTRQSHVFFTMEHLHDYVEQINNKNNEVMLREKGEEKIRKEIKSVTPSCDSVIKNISSDGKENMKMAGLLLLCHTILFFG